jgi:hypothetical protein
MKDPNKKYSIKAYYTPTKRFRTVIQVGSNEEICYDNMRKEGYTEPFEAIEIFDDPTEAQLNYAANLGIKVPADATKQDVSAMLDFRGNNDTVPNPRLLSFAYEQGLYVSKYIGEETLYDFLFEALDLPTKITFFIFSIYEHSIKTHTYNLNEHPFRLTFNDFSTLYVADDRFIKSMNRYRGSQLRYFGETNLGDYEYHFGGSKDTIAYKAAYGFLKSKGLLKLPSGQVSNPQKYPYQKKFDYSPVWENYPKYQGYQYKNEESSRVKGCIISLGAIFFLIYLVFSC